MLKRIARPQSQVEPGAVFDPRKIVGSLALVSLPAGTTITASEIGRPQNVALSVVLKRGMRAVSIGIDRVKAVGGLVQPGDRVDVIAVPPRAGNETPQGRTILRGVTVLASGTQMESTPVQANANNGTTAQTDPQNLTTVTLAVTPAQADVLATADVNATLRLALRSPHDAVGSEPAERFVLPAAAAPPARPVVNVAQPAAPVTAAVAPLAPAPPAPRAARAARTAASSTHGGVEMIEESPASSGSGS